MNQQLCKNCQHTFENNFCSNCGQKTTTTRLNWHFVKDELQYTFLHFNKGLLFTAKELFKRPGETIRDYIDGKRVQHYKPILLVFVLAGLTAFLSHYIDIEKIIPTSSSNSALSVPKYLDRMISHYAFIELGLIPIISLCSYFAFKKWGYNYIENIVINCFASAQRLLFGIAIFPIEYFGSSSKYFPIIAFFTTTITYLLSIWIYYKIYEKKMVIGDFILRFLLFIFLLGIIFLFMTIIGVIIALILTKIFHINFH